MANCLECEADLYLDEGEVEEGEIVHCEDCGFEMEVVNTSPIQLAPAGGADGWDGQEGSEPDE